MPHLDLLSPHTSGMREDVEAGSSQEVKFQYEGWLDEGAELRARLQEVRRYYAAINMQPQIGIE